MKISEVLCCAGCDYFAPPPSDLADYGECHGSTPLVILDQETKGLSATFPGVKRDDWCARNPKEMLRVMAQSTQQSMAMAQTDMVTAMQNALDLAMPMEGKPS